MMLDEVIWPIVAVVVFLACLTAGLVLEPARDVFWRVTLRTELIGFTVYQAVLIALIVCRALGIGVDLLRAGLCILCGTLACFLAVLDRP